MASFVEAACTAVHTALTDDATLVALVGAATQIRRANQKVEKEAPCVIIEPGDEDLPVASADELRQVEMTLHCYAAKDFDAGAIRDRAAELLNENINLSFTGFKIDMSFVRRITAPFWSPREQSFRCDLWLALNMKSTT